MDAEFLDELKDSSTQVGTVRGWESATAVLMRVATRYPEQVLECAEDAAAYNPNCA